MAYAVDEVASSVVGMRQPHCSQNQGRWELIQPEKALGQDWFLVHLLRHCSGGPTCNNS